MNKPQIGILIIAVMVGGLILSGTAQARMKCWKNNEGITECGDTVPPEFAQKGHKEIGESGIIREETERALTDEELEEKKRLEEMEAAKQRELEKQKQQDNILLSTFTSVQDIERARDERVNALDTSIKLTQARNEKIQEDLDKRIASAAAEERAGKQPSEALLKDIESLKRQLNNNDKFIAEKRAEQEEIKQEHAKDIKRFKKLKGIE